MMNGGDLYELAKILGHANIKMTERYAKLGKRHFARTGNTAREMWRLMQPEAGDNAAQAFINELFTAAVRVQAGRRRYQTSELWSSSRLALAW